MLKQLNVKRKNNHNNLYASICCSPLVLSYTLSDGTLIHAPAVQVQRAGTGMRHSEINPGAGGARCFNSNMTCKVGNLSANDSLSCNQKFVALITEENATANGLSVSRGDLLEGDSLHIEAISRLGMVLILLNVGDMTYRF